MRKILVSIGFLLTALVGAQTPGRYVKPYNLYRLDFDKAASAITFVAIIEAKGHHEVPRKVYLSTDHRDGWVIVEDVRVVDGLGIAPGTSVELVAEQEPPPGISQSRNHPEPRPTFEPGKSYLVFGLRPVEGKLYLPGELWTPQGASRYEYLPVDKPDEISMLTAFPTPATSLPKAVDAKDRLVKALIQALPMVSDPWDADRLMNLLNQSQSKAASEIMPENEYTKMLHDIVAKGDNRVAAFSAQSLLVRWNVEGTKAPFIAMVLKMAADPSFKVSYSQLPSGVTTIWRLPSRDDPIKYDLAKANLLAATSPSREFRDYLFRECARPTNASEWTLLVHSMTSQPRSYVDEFMLPQFAKWSGDEKGKLPVGKVVDPNKGIEVVNHDALVAYWNNLYPWPTR